MGGGVAGSTAPALREGELGAPEGCEAAASPLHLSSSPKLETLSHPPLLWSLLPRSRPRASRAPAPHHLLPEALPGLCSQGLFPLCSFSTVLVTSRPHRAPSEHTPKPTRSPPPPLRLLQPQHLWRLGPGRALGIAGSSAASQASARGISRQDGRARPASSVQRSLGATPVAVAHGPCRSSPAPRPARAPALPSAARCPRPGPSHHPWGPTAGCLRPRPRSAPHPATPLLPSP